jgi:hypothetical protein
MAEEESFHGRRILDHIILPVDGELESRQQTTAMAFGHLPEGRRLGHTPPPPRPFGRFGGIVAVDADRCWLRISTFPSTEVDESKQYSSR